MKREIKFRAWDNKLKVMYTLEKEKEFGDKWEPLWKIPESAGGIINYPDGELMQYTGLKDKNGKEIYEGDIFNTGSILIVIKIPQFFYLLESEMNSIDHPDNIEIIGNIYENPELL